MARVRIVEVDGDKYARVQDVVLSLREFEADCLRRGEREYAEVLNAVAVVVGDLTNTECR